MGQRRPSSLTSISERVSAAAPAAPYLGLVAATLAISCSAILIRFAQSPPLVIASYRMLFAVALLAPVLLATRWSRPARLDRADVGALVASGLCLAAHFGLWTASLGFTSVASSVVFVSTHPLFVAAAEVLILHRGVPRIGWVGIWLTVLGGLIIGYGDLQLAGPALTGDLLAIAGAIALVGYLLIGRRLRQRLDFLSYSTSVYVVCALGLALASIAFGGNLTEVYSNDWRLFLALAAVSTVGGHTVFNWTLRHLPASVVATSFVGEPVGASTLAWLALGEAPSAFALSGGLVILLGIYLTARYAC